MAENILLASKCVFHRNEILNWDLVSIKAQGRYAENQESRERSDGLQMNSPVAAMQTQIYLILCNKCIF